MKLRKKDLRRAKSRRYLNPDLEESWRAEDLREHYFAKLRALGYRFVRKRGPSSWKWKRFTTTFRRTIYLGVGWSKMSARSQAALLAHEYVHALQWRGERAFGMRYALDERYRWAVESQAYRETCRAFRAMRMAERAVQEYASNVPARFIEGYLITSQRLRHDIRREMADIVAAP